MLRDLLFHEIPSVKVVALVRVKTPALGRERVRTTRKAYDLYNNLGDEQLGLTQELWDDLLNRLDVVIHNGALVHLVSAYAHLKAADVLEIMNTLRLCAGGKAKHFGSVCSTSVLDTEYYVQECERITTNGGTGISETDDLEGGSSGFVLATARASGLENIWVGKPTERVATLYSGPATSWVIRYLTVSKRLLELTGLFGFLYIRLLNYPYSHKYGRLPYPYDQAVYATLVTTKYQ